MLRIRLARTGRRNQPKFRIVVAEKARPVKGKFIEVLGYYIPTGDKSFSVNKEAVQAWINKGAHPSDRVASLLKLKAEMPGMEKFITRNMNLKHKKKKDAGKDEAAEASAAPTKSTEQAEAVKEQPKEAVKPEPEVKKEPKEEVKQDAKEAA